MNNYPDAVAKIVNDYLDRVKAQLRLVPNSAQNEFLGEIQSHVYEAYQATAGADDVDKILAVLRKLGEPAEVVTDRLSGTMVRSGVRQILPLHILAGILIALFGIPLGFGGAAVLLGMLAALAGVVVSFYATAASVLLVATLLTVLGLTRMYQPELWDKLLQLGIIHMDGRLAEFMDRLSPEGQAFLMILLASIFAGAGLGMLWLGKHLVRGLRFLLTLAYECIRGMAARIRDLMRSQGRERSPSARPPWADISQINQGRNAKS